MNVVLLAVALWSVVAPQAAAPTPAAQRDLVVETRGEGERVVGDVPFVLEYRSYSAPRDPVVVLRARTDPDSGRAVLTDVVALREEHEQLAGGGVKPLEWSLHIAAAAAERPQRVVLPKVWPWRVRLNAADLVAIRVDVVDSAGARTFEGGEVRAQRMRWSSHFTEQVRGTWESAHDRSAGPHAAAIADGWARLWPVERAHGVGLAARLNVLSDWRLGWFDWTRSAGDAPFQLIVEPQIRTHRVRAYIDGQPLVQGTLTVARRRPGRPRLRDSDWDRGLDVTTDADGVAEFEIDSAAPFTLALRTRGADGRKRVAELTLPGPSAEASADAWEIGLLPPQLVRGFVVDPLGRPVADARIAITDGDSWAFNALPYFADESGRFEFQFLRSDRWNFRFSADGFAPRTLELPTSQHDQRIELAPTSVLSGYLRVADPLDVVDLNLVLLRREHGVPLESSPGCSLGCSCDGRFEFKDLQPGRYTLIVRRAGSGSAPIELARRDEIEILYGQSFDLGELRLE